MSDYQGNIVTKDPATPTGPSTFGRAPGMWKLNEVAYWIKQGVWPNPAIVPDIYFPYVSLLLSTTALGNANNNLFVDSSGAFNPVSRFGNTAQGSFTPYSTNWSNYFDGSGDYERISSSQTALQFGTGDFTVEGWVYSTGGTGTYQHILTGGSSWTSGSGGVFWYYNGGAPTLGCAWNQVTPNPAIQSSTLAVNTWHHFAVVRSGNTLTLYINGTSAGTLSVTGISLAVNNQSQTNIGGGGWDQDFGGYLSNLRVVKGTAVYTANFTPPTSPLTAITNTSLLTCQSNRFRDASTNNFTITVAGNTSVTDFGPFSPTYPGMTGYNQSDITNWSGYFDGSGDYLTTTNTNFTGDATVECWLYVNSLANPFQIFGTNNGVSDGRWIGALVATNGALAGGAAAGISSGYSSAAGTIKVGQWTHVAWVKTASGVFVYVNGTQVATCSLAQGYAYNATPLYISRLDGTDAYCLNGYISNLRVVNGTALYTSTFTPPTTPLTAISGTTLLTLQNAAFTDNSTNNYVVTPFGNTTVTGNSPFNTVGYWSNYFNGSSYLIIPVTSSAFTLPGDFTLEGWVNRASGSGLVMFDSRSGGNYTDWVVGVNGSGQVDFVTVGGPGVRITTTETVAANTWTHIACVRQGSTIKIYINGVASVNTATYSSTITPASSVAWVGTSKDPIGTTGYLSNLRLVKGTAVYTTNFTPPTSPLTAISGTSLLTCQNGRFIDNSTNAFAITVSGSPQAQSFDPFYTATIASNGGSMYFDGSGDYLQVPTNASLQFGTSDFTVEFWMNLIARDSSGTAVFNNYNSFTTGALGFFAGHASASSTVYQVAVNGTFPAISSTQTIVYNSWNHFAIVRNGNTLTLYINGVANGTFSMSGITINGVGSNWWLGSAQDAPSNYELNGYLANFRVSKFAVYTAAFTPPTAPLTPSANTTLLINGMNAGIYDATTINDMETVGNAQVSTVQSKFGGSSMYFDGTDDRLVIPTTPQFGFGTGDYTIEFWLYMSALPGTKYTLLDFRTASTAQPHTVYVSSSGYMGFYNGSADVTSSSQPLSINTWYHVAYSRGSGTLKIFVAGTQAYSASNTIDYQATRPLSIGGAVGGIEVLNGYIDDVRITKGVARYTSNFTPPTQPFPIY